MLFLWDTYPGIIALSLSRIILQCTTRQNVQRRTPPTTSSSSSEGARASQGIGTASAQCLLHAGVAPARLLLLLLLFEPNGQYNLVQQRLCGTKGEDHPTKRCALGSQHESILVQLVLVGRRQLAIKSMMLLVVECIKQITLRHEASSYVFGYSDKE